MSFKKSFLERLNPADFVKALENIKVTPTRPKHKTTLDASWANVLTCSSVDTTGLSEEVVPSGDNPDSSGNVGAFANSPPDAPPDIQQQIRDLKEQIAVEQQKLSARDAIRSQIERAKSHIDANNRRIAEIKQGCEVDKVAQALASIPFDETWHAMHKGTPRPDPTSAEFDELMKTWARPYPDNKKR